MMYGIGRRSARLQKKRLPSLYYAGPAHGIDSVLVTVAQPIEPHRILVEIYGRGEVGFQLCQLGRVYQDFEY